MEGQGTKGTQGWMWGWGVVIGVVPEPGEHMGNRSMTGSRRRRGSSFKDLSQGFPWWWRGSGAEFFQLALALLRHIRHLPHDDVTALSFAQGRLHLLGSSALRASSTLPFLRLIILTITWKEDRAILGPNCYTYQNRSITSKHWWITDLSQSWHYLD